MTSYRRYTGEIIYRDAMFGAAGELSWEHNFGAKDLMHSVDSLDSFFHDDPVLPGIKSLEVFHIASVGAVPLLLMPAAEDNFDV